MSSLRELNAGTSHGITKLINEDIFINFHGYETLPEKDSSFEGHVHMIDLQYAISGGEYEGGATKGDLIANGECHSENDFQFFHAPEKGSLARIHLQSGCFAILFPEDGRRPKIQDGVNDCMHKAVLKINRKIFV